MSAGVAVTGGSDGIDAPLPQLREGAARLAAVVADLRALVEVVLGLCRGVPLDQAARLDPLAAARFEAATAAAVGPARGLPGALEHLDQLARALQRAVATYEDADRAARAGPDLSTVFGTLLRLPVLPDVALAALLGGGSPGDAAYAALHTDPGLTDLTMATVGLPAAALVDPLLDDGHPVVTARGPDTVLDRSGPPRSFADLMSGLAGRNEGSEGEIGIRRLTGVDGSASWVVEIPGTKSWQVADGPHITSVVTNSRAIAGRATSYERGVLAAMTAAGVGPHDPVLLVGHSQGGMVAANAAISCAASGRFRVTNVVTAGSPVGLLTPRLPPSVAVLAMENRPDVVPRLDATPNRPRPNVTTAIVDHRTGTIGGDHGIRTAYLPGAVDLDRSRGPAVEAYWRSAIPFLTATRVDTSVYVVTRGY